MKRFSKPTKTTALLLAIIAILLIALIVILVFPGSEGTPASNQQPTVTVPQTALATPYCELKYPEQWKDQMTVQESSGNGIVSYNFYALIAGKQYELYSVHFGESEGGDLFGYIPNNGTDLPVYIECHSIANWNELTETELTLYYSMMEGVNEIAQSIAATPGYYKP